VITLSFLVLQETIQKTDANGKLLPEMVGGISDKNTLQMI
jgi:hypothetical protein